MLALASIALLALALNLWILAGVPADGQHGTGAIAARRGPTCPEWGPVTMSATPGLTTTAHVALIRAGERHHFS
ncbi:hypothetical protein ASE63_13180 [Bosea sp. Root381]|jgi:hypothetical protein|nr:hypothetical protein ASE63_13180 [Bosea sp. Root381]